MRHSLRLGAGLPAIIATAVVAISLAGGPADAKAPLALGTPSERAPSCLYAPPCPSATPFVTPTVGPTAVPRSTAILGGGGFANPCNDVSEQRWTAPGMPI